jgi:Ricin-type beta-trefoil lectin domain
MITLPQLKHAALIASLAYPAGCSDVDVDGDIDQVSNTSSDLEALPEIRSVLNNKCLAISGIDPSNGAHVVMWDCTGGAEQHWYWNGEEIRNYLNNRCLAISGVDPNNGAHVVMWDCTGGAEQHWYRDGSQIKNRLNNRCLDILGVNPNNGAHVGMWDCSGSANQQWY